MLSANYFSLTVVVITFKQPFYRSLEKDSQPFRHDKQFGLSFLRMGSVPDDLGTESPEGVSGIAVTPTSTKQSDEETDEDGVMRLKKASGLMGCLRYKKLPLTV